MKVVAYVFEAGGEQLAELLSHSNVIVSPHVGGWTVETYYKLSKVLADKIEASGFNRIESRFVSRD